MPDRMGQSAKLFGGDDRTWTEFDGPGGARHTVAEHQFPIRATVDKYRWNSYKRCPMAGDLTL
jgi:hypothetical protein